MGPSSDALRRLDEIDYDELERDLEKLVRSVERKRYQQLMAIRREKLRQVDGNSLRVTDVICDCGHFSPHYKMIVMRDGKDISEPLCPVTVGLRRIRLNLERRKTIDKGIINKLLERCLVKSKDGNKAQSK